MKLLDTIDRVAVAIAVLALLSMMLMTTVSVIGRHFFLMPIPDDLAINEMLMVVVVFLPFGAVQAAREHVFVTIFTEWMSNDAKVVLETIGVVVGFAIFTLVAVAAWTDFLICWDDACYVEGLLELPEYPARLAAVFGLALFAIRLFVDAVLSVSALAKGTAVATQSEEDRFLEANKPD